VRLERALHLADFVQQGVVLSAPLARANPAVTWASLRLKEPRRVLLAKIRRLVGALMGLISPQPEGRSADAGLSW